MDEPAPAHELDASETKSIKSGKSGKTSVPKIQGYNTLNEKMVSPMRSEPAHPFLDQAMAERASLDDAGSRAGDDSLSVHSTSSRSFFRTPMMRRRNTDRSTADKERTRRSSVVLSDDDAGGLGAELTVQLQKQGKGMGEWGIGDEARMSLE